MSGKNATAIRPVHMTLALLSLAVLVALLGWAAISEWDGGQTEASVTEMIRSSGAWGIAVSMLLMVAHSFLPFPAEAIALANGMVYGPLWGTLITWSGAMLGAWAAFGLARLLGRRFAEAMVAKRKLQPLDDLSRLQGAKLVLVARLIPVIAFNLINYAAGLTAISWWSFTWSTALGILPLTFLMNLFGYKMRDVTWEVWAMTGLGVAALCLLLAPILRQFRSGAAKDNDR